ncbi:unnamed protein product [Closterium sp. NIES-64]|nr:unnamed protein product [Closterium sp. NIES-64]CAI5990795.1 unnamed protein product [Closterium sp. NIES-64]
MAATTVSASLKAASLVQPKVNAASLKAAPVSQAFGLKTASSKVSCSLEENVRGFVQKAADAGKTAALALASTALLASAEIPRLTFDELQSLTYSEVKGSGIANQCPIIAGGVDGFAFKSGKYQLTKMCLEPTSFTVKAESQFKGQGEEFQKTKLMTRLTYTLDEIEGPLEVSGDKIKFTEVDGIDYAAVTVQLSGGERVPFLFTIKELVASGTPDSFGGSFLVPSYRGATFLDPKGRGGAQGYDSAVALPAGGFGDNEKLRKENEKSYKSLSGNITFSVAKSNVETGEIGGVFTSVQPSDTDMGAKVPKDVKIQGIWYAQCRPKSSKGKSRLGLPLTPVPAGSGSRKRLEDDTEYIHIDLDEEINR